ncbi:hypothetical protein M9H77_35995 [Catharanthus roseus]|uniref:Uncharacterized protein n=1 Tax=Catharanthus roseus TaxID=4058 RepID=A0ACB9ZUA3_CATRO|nr:hypothetical protein M9H77_35995 [Catharanthus roseus]
MQCEGQLSPTIYDNSCPNALSTILTSIRQAVSCDCCMAGSLIRLHFHDCFVQGYDASILINEVPSIESEQTALLNLNSVRGYNAIEAAKRETYNCSKGASVLVGGPSWEVKLERRDSTTASRTRANTDLPAFFKTLILFLENSMKRVLTCGTQYTITKLAMMLALQAQRRRCPRNDGDTNLASLDLVTPNLFENNYFRNVMQRKGLLHSDQVLYSGGSTDIIVSEYSNSINDNILFLSDVAAAMIKIGEIEPLAG